MSSQLKSRMAAPRASFRSSSNNATTTALFAPLQTQSAPDSRGLPLFQRPNHSNNNTNSSNKSNKSKQSEAPQYLADSEQDEAANVKYNKRLQRARRKRMQQQQNKGTSNTSGTCLPRTLILVGLFLLVLAFWKVVGRFLSSRAPALSERDRQARRERLALLHRERSNGKDDDDDGGETDLAKLLLKDHSSLAAWEAAFEQEQLLRKTETGSQQQEEKHAKGVETILNHWLAHWDATMQANVVSDTIRWIRPYLLPPLPGSNHHDIWHDDQEEERARRQRRHDNHDKASVRSEFFHAKQRNDQTVRDMAWHDAWEALTAEQQARGPAVDYTDPNKYTYPQVLLEPPATGGYPGLRTLNDILTDWPQDEDLQGSFAETLVHFDFTNPVELEAAARFREAELPFKLTNVPELVAANAKWTDEYVAEHFISKEEGRGIFPHFSGAEAKAQGTVQESPNNFFAFFTPKQWRIETMGLPPVRNNDWSFATWAKHARYADAVSLEANQPHYYFQSGVPPEEHARPEKDWSFISKDLPSWSQPEDSTFFVFHPEERKGIQCRFGERGVVAATHYDSGRNMIAMITGAKRYILAPPNQCSKLGIATSRHSPIYRHSLLNFGHIRHLDADADHNMSDEERAWLERASSSKAIDTVLKAGEVLYIPSFYFHYIVSIQKSAQCNARSGINKEFTSEEFGGYDSVIECLDE